MSEGSGETWGARLEDLIVRTQFGEDAERCLKRVRNGDVTRDDAGVVAKLLRHGVLCRGDAGDGALRCGSVYKRLQYAEYVSRIADDHGRAAALVAETVMRGGVVPTVRVVSVASQQLAKEQDGSRGSAEERVRQAVDELIKAGLMERIRMSPEDAAAAAAEWVYLDEAGAIREDPTALTLCFRGLADASAKVLEKQLVAKKLGPAPAAEYDRLIRRSKEDDDDRMVDDDSVQEEEHGTAELNTLCGCGFCTKEEKQGKITYHADRKCVQDAIALDMLHDVVRRKFGAESAQLFSLLEDDRSKVRSTASLAQRAIIPADKVNSLLHSMLTSGYVRCCAAENSSSRSCWWWYDQKSANALCVEELCRALVILVQKQLKDETSAEPLRALETLTDEQQSALSTYTDEIDRTTTSILHFAQMLVFLTSPL